MNIKLGNKLRCAITGFTGIATAKIEYINGCVQFLVKPRLDKEGKSVEGQYLDWQQLEVIEGGIEIKGAQTGGPSSSAPKTYGG